MGLMSIGVLNYFELDSFFWIIDLYFVVNLLFPLVSNMTPLEK